MIHFRLQLIGILTTVLAGVAGCTSDPRATISGKVTYKDKPVPAGTVVFLSEDGTKQDRAEITDGTYSTSTVPLGKLKVGVVPAGKGVSKMMPKGAKTPKLSADDPLSKVYGQSGAEYVDIPEALRSPDTSNITVNVEADTKTFDISLKSPKK